MSVLFAKYARFCKNQLYYIDFSPNLSFFKNLFSKFAPEFNKLKNGEFDRLKAVLADSGKTNKWLAEQLGKDPVTISKWCTNTTQPDLQTLAKISELLKINIRELLVNQNF